MLKQMFNRYKNWQNIGSSPHIIESLRPLTSVSDSSPEIDNCVASKWKDGGKEECLENMFKITTYIYLPFWPFLASQEHRT